MQLLVTGASGLIGRNFVNKVNDYYPEFEILGVSSKEADLRVEGSLSRVLKNFKADIIVHFAALVGGINANISNKYKFLYENTKINLNTIHEALDHDVEYILAAGTGCAYPKSLEGKEHTEDQYLNGTPEPTNDAYAYAKRLLLNQLSAANESFGLNYSYILPANIYGPYDNFHRRNSHVVPGIIQRMHDAMINNSSTFEIWGSGKAKRDFLYIDDLMDAIILIIKTKTCGVINIGSGIQTKITDLADEISKALKCEMKFVFDTDKPDGQLTRVVNCDFVKQLGWKPKTTLDEGIKSTVEWFLQNPNEIRRV